MLPDLVPGERRCRRCLVDLMRRPHDEKCPERPRPDDVRRLALDPATKRIEDVLAACHRKGVRAWLKSGRTL